MEEKLNVLTFTVSEKDSIKTMESMSRLKETSSGGVISSKKMLTCCGRFVTFSWLEFMSRMVNGWSNMCVFV